MLWFCAVDMGLCSSVQQYQLGKLHAARGYTPVVLLLLGPCGSFVLPCGTLYCLVGSWTALWDLVLLSKMLYCLATAL
jgi:hypothetical protein